MPTFQPRPADQHSGGGTWASPRGADSDMQPRLRTPFFYSNALTAPKHILLHVTRVSPLGWAESSLNRHSPSYKAFQLKQTLPPISVQLYGHHNIAPEAAVFCPKVINYSLSCVLSEHHLFLPGIGWPLLQCSSCE